MYCFLHLVFFLHYFLPHQSSNVEDAKMCLDASASQQQHCLIQSSSSFISSNVHIYNTLSLANLKILLFLLSCICLNQLELTYCPKVFFLRIDCFLINISVFLFKYLLQYFCYIPGKNFMRCKYLQTVLYKLSLPPTSKVENLLFFNAMLYTVCVL